MLNYPSQKKVFSWYGQWVMSCTSEMFQPSKPSTLWQCCGTVVTSLKQYTKF